MTFGLELGGVDMRVLLEHDPLHSLGAGRRRERAEVVVIVEARLWQQTYFFRS